MRDFHLNILFALVWVALTGVFTLGNLAAGFAAGLLVLWLTRRRRESSVYHSRIQKLFAFCGFFMRELLVANIKLTHDILTPTHHMRPGIVAVPLDITGDLPITLLGAVITLTPGTLVVEISEDHDLMYIHVMYLTDREDFVRRIKDGFERRVAELFT